MSVYNVAVFGSAGVGKSTFLSRLSNHYFSGIYKATIGHNTTSIKFIVMFQSGIERIITINFTDHAGQEMLGGLTRQYNNNIFNAGIFIADVTSVNTFNSVNIWLSRFTNINFNNLFLVINKIDCRSVFPSNSGYIYYISAKTTSGMEVLIKDLIEFLTAEKIINCSV
jgi:small GTP-binding protein